MKKKSFLLIRFGVISGIVLFSSFCILLAYFSRGNIQNSLKGVSSAAGTLESSFFDTRYRYYLKHDPIQKNKKSEHVALLEIDDVSLEKYGRWPWSRSQWSSILQKLEQYGAKVISFDIIFSEPEKVCGGTSPDLFLAKSIQSFNQNGGSTILPYSLASMNDPAMEEMPPELYEFILDSEVRPPVSAVADSPNIDDASNPNHLYLSKLNRTTFPIETLRIEGSSYGFLDTSADADGVFRHFPVLANVEYLYIPSLALASYMKYTGEKPKLTINSTGDAKIEIEETSFDVNKSGEARVKFLGDESRFDRINVIKLLESNPAQAPQIQDKLQGKVVYIALTAVGNANDIRATPISPQTPGVLMHMNLTHSLIEKDFFKSPSEAMIYSFLILIIGILFIVFSQVFKNPIIDLFILLAIIGGTLALDSFYFLPRSYELKLFFCFVAFTLTYIWNTFLNFYLTSAEKKEVRGAFSKMVDKGIVDELLKNPEKLQLGGERKEITVFFSDVRDFTTISEKLTPEQLTHALNIYMTRMTDILIEHKGTLDKYIGDAIVGYWGAPVEITDHAYRAILASKEQLEALPEINERFKKENLPLFKVGIGLNSGFCSVGNMGSNQIFQYTALGDNMNLGARLEGLCKPYHSKLLISEFTYAQLTDSQKSDFLIRRMDKVRVKGKENAVEILEVLDNTHLLYKHPDVIEAFNESFELYLKRDFQKAISLLKKYGEKFDDWSIKNLMEKCQTYLEKSPPKDWDGVVTFTTK